MEHKIKLAEGHEGKKHSHKEKEGSVASLVSSPEVKVTTGVVGAGLAGLIAASVLGAAPVAIAGAAGYLAYRAMKGQHL
jgi:hypothetical protein